MSYYKICPALSELILCVAIFLDDENPCLEGEEVCGVRHVEALLEDERDVDRGLGHGELGPDSREKNWLQFRFEIPYTKKKLKNG